MLSPMREVSTQGVDHLGLIRGESEASCVLKNLALRARTAQRLRMTPRAYRALRMSEGPEEARSSGPSLPPVHRSVALGAPYGQCHRCNFSNFRALRASLRPASCARARSLRVSAGS